MVHAYHTRPAFKPSASFVSLCLFLAILWIAGGSSRADASGQLVVRIAAWVVILGMLLFGQPPRLRAARAVLLLLAAALLLLLLQLVPLPPSIWLHLPGRALLAEAASASGQPQPWRPLAIVPEGVVNAASSLVVPFAMLLLLCGLDDRERAWLPGVLLGVIIASALLGLFQLTGAGVDHPLINDSPGEIGGSFANRNHFALLLALGCLIAPAWAFLSHRRPRWRPMAALGLVLLFGLMILATGSRAGMATGGMALLAGLGIALNGIRRELRRMPRWVFPLILAGLLAAVALFVLLSIAADRAASFQRLMAIDPGQDMRAQALPTIFAMIRLYWPAGSGFGGFDRLFMIHEPLPLLRSTYFNHAHNDFVEMALDGGLAGILLLIAMIAWWGAASWRAWRGGADMTLARVGSTMLLLIGFASLVDYPARTPMMMAIMVIAAVWMANGASAAGTAALPRRSQPL